MRFKFNTLINPSNIKKFVAPLSITSNALDYLDDLIKEILIKASAQRINYGWPGHRLMKSRKKITINALKSINSNSIKCKEVKMSKKSKSRGFKTSRRIKSKQSRVQNTRYSGCKK